MRTAALELSLRGITVNAVLPGNIATEGLAELGDEALAEITASIPARRLGSPEDIGNACLFLATEEAAYITGQTLIVDGNKKPRPVFAGPGLNESYLVPPTGFEPV